MCKDKASILSLGGKKVNLIEELKPLSNGLFLMEISVGFNNANVIRLAVIML